LSTRRQASRQATPTPTPAENGSNGQRNSVVLGPNDRLVGQLYIEGDLRVAGTVEGTLEATGDIEISGKVSGDVTAYNRLIVGGDASVIAGEVRVGRLTVADGAQFSGKVSMGKPAAQAPKAVEPEPVVEVAPVIQAVPAAAEPEPVRSKSEPVRAKSVQQKGKRR
jgi:cytoskeletal protein CcmA (bactofilin family)